MKVFILTLSLFILNSCQKNTISSDAEINIFFQRLSVLVTKVNTISFNIQNVNTTRTIEGGVFVPKEATNCKNGKCEILPLKCKGIGCNPDNMREDGSFLKYEPKHPDANSEGYVSYPNINIMEEMAKLVRVQMALEYLVDSAPVPKGFFYSMAIKKYLKKYPELNNQYNFEAILRE